MGDLTVKEAANIMTFDERWVRELLRTGKLQGHRNGRRWLISEEEVKRYRSGNTGSELIVRDMDQVFTPWVGRENLQATLMLEQARASMSRHSVDLKLEAGRWSDILKGFHQDDDCYDYVRSELDFFRTPGGDSTIPVCFCIHLMHGFPETYQKFRDWEGQVPSYRAGVLSLWREWLSVVSKRLVREKRLHEGAYGKKYSLSDHNRIRFASTLWREIFKDSLKGYPSLRDKDKSLGFPLIEICMKAGFCRSSYLSQEIASGTREWVNCATVLHQRIYHENKYSLPEEMQKRGLLDQKNRLKGLALETSSTLDIISRGGAIFKPGHCYFCARLLF